MRLRRICLAASLLAASGLIWKHRPPASPAGAPPATGDSPRENRAPVAAETPEAPRPLATAEAAARRRELLTRLAYAQNWDAEREPALTAFRAWTQRHREAAEVDRSALEAEGVALAQARRVVMQALIRSDPERALAATVPAVVRASLPEAVRAELETRVGGRGEFALVARSPGPDRPAPESALRRITVLRGATYTSYVYGRREPQTSLAGVPLHGIAVGRELALHESPLRVLEPEEVPATAVDDTCPVSDQAVMPPVAGAGVNTGTLNFAEVAGRVVELCDTGADMLATYAAVLAAADENAGPRMANPPARAAEAPTAWTTGTKQVLVIRVDFSDVPGEPMTQAAALNVMNAGVRPLFEEMSYGQTSFVTTVSDNVYRMPQTGSAYALADNEGQMHTDARTAAGAHYTVANFDRVIVLFPNIGTGRFPGSRITFGGEGIINGANIWINGSGSFVTATVAHELGHTYGLLHSNLWRINDGNPVSPAGNTLEYGDPFDTMGSTSVTGVARDTRHHFNHWHKNRLGWLPDSAVTTVTTSGTYRVHRFDSRDVPRNQPLALRIFRDGVRWYWVGLRQNFSTGAPQANGAHVIWGFNNRQQSQLLDLVTPGAGANDATLPVGTTFSDPAFGVTIRPAARGGTEPSQYLDVEVTMTPPPQVVATWGREGAYFFDGNTGTPALPVPETHAPPGLNNVRAIAAGDQHALALKADGTVVAWGDHVNGQTTVPAGLSEVVAIAAGADTSGAVRADGTVRMWGLNTSGHAVPPAGLTNVTQLAIGRNHTAALRSDGTVVAWGANNLGQATVPAGLTDVVAITSGTEFSVALKRDGTVVSWGGAFGRPPAGLTGVTAIAAGSVLAGGQFVVALKNDGTVVSWGANNEGQTNVPAGLNGVVAVAAGAFHALAVKNDGSVVAWGGGPAAARTLPRELPRTRAVAASAAGSFALVGPSILITAQPQDDIIAAGGTAVLRVQAAGLGPVTYQWRKDGVAIAGATNSTLTVNAAGNYDAELRDSLSTLTTSVARLTQAAGGPEASRISNLSIRTNAGTGAQTLIVGFVIGGGGTKPLLVRGVGPALTGFGVANALADPRVELFAGAARMLENDNWNAADAPVFARVGAFALTPGSRDAALFNGGLATGSYSAQLSGVGTATGVVLAEIYDATPSAGFGATMPRLVNVSARAVSGTGANLLIAGFTIAGPTAKTVLIRAIGPTLTVFGVTGVLADPRLELYNSAAVRIQENDNWGGNAALTSAFSAVGAFQLVGDSRDAALLATLQPGSYTAQVSGGSGGTGVALVEVYEVP